MFLFIFTIQPPGVTQLVGGVQARLTCRWPGRGALGQAGRPGSWDGRCCGGVCLLYRRGLVLLDIRARNMGVPRAESVRTKIRHVLRACAQPLPKALEPHGPETGPEVSPWRPPPPCLCWASVLPAPCRTWCACQPRSHWSASGSTGTGCSLWRRERGKENTSGVTTRFPWRHVTWAVTCAGFRYR